MNPWKHIEDKIIRQEQVTSLMTEWRKENTSVVFTNGCFDLLHFGHVRYLAEAKGLGTHLVIGLNSDSSVKRLKGDHRPIKDEKSRAYILAALECVDALIIFEEDTPLELIKKVSPDILVKGGDWKPEEIVGSDIVFANGGKVLSLNYVEGYSTTRLEDKIRNSSEN